MTAGENRKAFRQSTRLIKLNLITQKEQVGRSVDQKLHEGLPDYLCGAAVWKNHVNQTVEGKEQRDLRYDEQFRDGAFTSKARHTCGTLC